MTLCMLCKYCNATSLHKFKDSKISHIKPAPQINYDNNINSVHHNQLTTNQQLIKNNNHHHHHVHHSKATSLDSSKKHLSNHDLLK